MKLLHLFLDTRDSKGFTLVELMIVVAIVAILAAVAFPNFIAYRDKSRIASSVATCDAIVASMAGYAATSKDNHFPFDLPDWTTLVSVCNSNGATLKDTMTGQGFSGFTYSTVDTDNDGIGDSYMFTFWVAGVAASLTGSQIEVSPSGIYKQTQ
jgi:prepilin-type N-terminal cleavage/methylation domain-containing protein